MNLFTKSCLVLSLAFVSFSSVDAQYRPTKKQGGSGALFSPSRTAQHKPSQQCLLEAARPACTVSYASALSNDKRVTLLVKLNHSEATLRIQDQATEVVGLERLFVSPELELGKTYEYTLVTTWKVDGKEMHDMRTVKVKAGSSVLVDFTKPVREQVNSMPK